MKGLSASPTGRTMKRKGLLGPRQKWKKAEHTLHRGRISYPQIRDSQTGSRKEWQPKGSDSLEVK